MPLLVLDVDKAEAYKLLATLDPLAAMAETDKLAFNDLASFVQTDSAELRELLDGTAGIARDPAAREIAAAGGRDQRFEISTTFVTRQMKFAGPGGIRRDQVGWNE